MYANSRPIVDQSRRISVALVMLMVACGCDSGPELGTVTGRVTLDGQPVEHATVTFQPTSGPASFGITDSQGRYELSYSDGKPGAVLGLHTVVIETYRITLDEGDNAIEVPETIPARYNIDSDIQKEIKAGSQQFDFDLVSE